MSGDRIPLFSRAAIRRLILPLIVEQFLAVPVGMADTVMVASVGEAAVSGISIVDTLNILLINDKAVLEQVEVALIQASPLRLAVFLSLFCLFFDCLLYTSRCV